MQKEGGNGLFGLKCHLRPLVREMNVQLPKYVMSHLQKEFGLVVKELGSARSFQQACAPSPEVRESCLWLGTHLVQHV